MPQKRNRKKELLTKRQYTIITFIFLTITIILIVSQLFDNLDKKKDYDNCDPETMNCEILKDLNSDIDIERFNLARDIGKINNSIGMVIIANYLDNKNKLGKYQIPSNEDLFAKLENRQLFILEQIINTSSTKDFIILDNTGKIIEQDPTEDATIAYYPYNKFNKEYKKYFIRDFDMKKAKNSLNNNKYDKDNNYVYYNNRRAGLNGVSLENISISGLSINENEENTYTATLGLKYTKRTKEVLGVERDTAELTYKRYKKNIEIKTLKIK